jgi:hypothetical protein
MVSPKSVLIGERQPTTSTVGAPTDLAKLVQPPQQARPIDLKTLVDLLAQANTSWAV